MISYNQIFEMIIFSKFSIVIWLPAYIFPSNSMFNWLHISKKCGENKCVLDSKSVQYCATFLANIIKHEHCCVAFLKKSRESHFIDFDY